MEELLSNSKDCRWLADKLKNIMGINLNQLYIYDNILTGIYYKHDYLSPFHIRKSIKFYIKFLKNGFLRIQIEMGINENKDIAVAMNELVKAISTIEQDEEKIDLPLAIYKINGYLTSEYAFIDKKETIEGLKNNSLFLDGDIECLTFLRNCCNCINSYYSYLDETSDEILYCKADGRNTETSLNEICEDHKCKNVKKPNIKVLCMNICDNKNV